MLGHKYSRDEIKCTERDGAFSYFEPLAEINIMSGPTREARPKLESHREG